MLSLVVFSVMLSLCHVYRCAKVYANVDFSVDIPLTRMGSRELIW